RYIHVFKQKIKDILKKYHIREVPSERLAWFYGPAVHELIKYGLGDPVWFEGLNKDFPAIKGEVRHAVEKEMALSLNDFMVRRAALLLFGNDQDIDKAKSVADIMRDI